MAGTIDIRDTTEADLDWVLELENHPEAMPWIGLWNREEHRDAMISPGRDHLVITDAGKLAGYAILLDLDSPYDSIQLKRIVVARRGAGIGKAALPLIADRVFETHGGHRLWLDVVESNERARRAYRAAGFTEEGLLRDVWRNAEGRQSLVVLSLLEPEWRARRAN